MAAWEQMTGGLEHGGYVAWEASVDAALQDSVRDHVAVFVRLAPTPGMSLVQAIDRTLALRDLRIGRHERDLMATERAMALTGGQQEVRFVAYWPRSRLGDVPEYWKVLHVGPGLAIAGQSGADPGIDLTAVRGDLSRAVPLVAVIDDGIAFLNARLRRTQTETRLRAIWLQAPESGPASGDVLCGRVLTAADIERYLAEGQDEAEVYRTLNRQLHRVTDLPLTSRHAAHGTHVLDLAAGAAPWAGEAMSGVPLLAVQLPPSSIRETSGRRMETYLVQGLRWVLAEALRQANGTDVPPVVVNISLGSLAGPGDRHVFLAEWMTFELARHARMTGGAEVRIVVAYGNARLDRLVARAELRRTQPMELWWRVQPDDYSSSFVELRADQTQIASLMLRIVPPVGSGLPDLDVAWPANGAGWSLPGPIAAVSGRNEEGGQSQVLLAIGPTAGTGRMPATPSGAWRIEVRTTDIEPVLVTARVQRDDTPQGYRTLGRQSWLDHPQAWDWDPELRGYLTPRAAEDAPGCPVTREGTSVAYAGVDDPRILFVGAARPVIGTPGMLRPTFYSAEGVRHLARPDESRGPTLIALGDTGMFAAGVPGAGVPSGSVVRMSGTSVAAPQVTRALAGYFLQVPAAERSATRERDWLTDTADWHRIDPRRGHGSLRNAGV